MHVDYDDEANTPFPAGPPKVSAGYKAPPEKHQFQKGKSGNPRGRPKGANSRCRIVERVLLEEHEIVEDGRRIRRTTLELILLALRNKAFEGNNRAFKEWEKIDTNYDPQKLDKPAGVLVVPGRLTKESWVELFSPKISFEQQEE